jgi:hypothetical protein
LEVLVERVIPRPPERVAGYAMDWRHDAEWTQGIDSVELSAEADGGGFGVGAEVTRTSHFLGRRIDYAFQVLMHEPPRRLVLKSIAGPFRFSVVYRYDPHPGGTLASILVSGSIGGYLRIGSPVARAVLRSHLRKCLRELARNLG